MNRSWSPQVVRMMPGHGFLMHSLPERTLRFRVALIVHNHRFDAEERPTGTARLRACERPGKRRDQDAARFGLPPGVDDRATFLAHTLR